MSSQFVHLRLHTDYSMVDGLIKIKPLIKRASETGMQAIALTEHNNLFSLVKFYRLAMNEGIKPVIGSDVFIFDENNRDAPYRITLLAQNNEGYIKLSELLSKAYQENQINGLPMIRKEWLEGQTDHLIALSGAMDGEIARALAKKDEASVDQLIARWTDLFPDRFYLELQRIGKPGEEHYIDQACKVAQNYNLPVVATNDVRFLNKTDFENHEARVCINQKDVLSNPYRENNYTSQQYLRTADEMVELFADIPSAIENTVEIARRCTLDVTLGKNFLPDFPVPKGVSLSEHFENEARKGLADRLRLHPPIGQGTIEENTRVYEERLQMELDVINQMGFPGYFMIVADFILWAKNNHIPVGPGRGSGAGSLVAYSLKITDLDPIEFDLLFERFLNPERVSMPDFDVDFCMERRDEVIDYVAQHYGREKVSQIITYGSMAAKAVIRDVGRVQGLNYSFVDQIAKLIPFEVGITLERALKESDELGKRYQNENEVKTLIDMAMALEGTVRNAGKHAGGVVIAPTKLTDFAPLYCDDEGNNLVTQYDKDDIEAVGLVKFDFLGLRTLTIIDWALQTINNKQEKKKEQPVDISVIPKDDESVFQLLQNAETTAVFQLESRGMKELIKKLKPDCFDDIIALVALFRPGPLEAGMVDDYIRVKHGAKAEYSHPLLEPILKPTNGVILYQEQVMEIARKMAGYTLGGADLLRRAMGKKKPEEMAKQRTVFTEGAIKNGIPDDIATHTFDLMEKFAGYGFNKSHSAAYALIAYQTAWLKKHYPAEFMAAVLSSDMDNTDKVVFTLEECHRMQLKVVPPNINLSEIMFSVNNYGEIVYGIGALKGVGEAAVEELLAQRMSGGDFKDLYDLVKRVDTRKVNKRVMEALCRAGALDVFDSNRAAHFEEIPNALKLAEQHRKIVNSGQNDMFGFSVRPENEFEEKPGYINNVKPWEHRVRLNQEKSVLGLYLTGHPIDQFLAEIDQARDLPLGELLEEAQSLKNDKKKVVLAGQVMEIRTKQTRGGQTMAFVTIDDKTGRAEITCFGHTYDHYMDQLVEGNVLVFNSELSLDDYSGRPRAIANQISDLEEVRLQITKSLVVRWHTNNRMNQLITELKDLLEPHIGGNCPVVVEYQNNKAKCKVQLGSNWNVRPDNELKNKLQSKEDEFDAFLNQ
ncbi:DNA polymerase III subunit alpha (plasmid) [Methylomarinum sp. Ch1-1]|uniref:DNA polymerase III subunit alpha n=1 Tax=Methylomarinum roseum TaxID=3067653 RepID=A0AAU7P0B9_9GAMM